MIIYGSRATQLVKEGLSDKCPHCGSYSLQLYIFQRYAHVFWIPMFPIGKIGVAECTSCKKTWKKKEFSDTTRLSYQNLKSQAKTPAWTFTGLGVLAVIIGITIYSEQKKKEKSGKLILAPVAGDVFEIKLNDGQYTLYKVNDVRSDSVFVNLSEYETNMESGFGDLKNKGESAFSAVSIGLTKKQLKEMFDKGEIINVERK
jgi:hypothetical protein